jgi:hypothetical protein
MAKTKYWLALIDFSPSRSNHTPGEPVGGVAWVVGAAPTTARFKRVVTHAPELVGYSITEWMELVELEPGYSSEALDGDAIVAELERSQRAIYVDEIQWYMAEDDTD